MVDLEDYKQLQERDISESPAPLGNLEMKALGFMRKVDKLGRIVIPKEVREEFNYQPGMPVEIFVTEEGDVLIRIYEYVCYFCQEPTTGKKINGRGICDDCVKEIRKYDEELKEKEDE